MAPLLLAGFGLLFVVVVVRTHGVDVVPDTVGLGLYAVAMSRLAGRARFFTLAAWLAATAAVLALVDFVPGSIPDWLATTLAIAFNALVGLAITVGALGCRAAAGAAGDAVTRQFSVVSVLAATGLACFLLGWLLHPVAGQTLTGVLALGSLVTLVAMVWYLVLLVVCSPRDWAKPVAAVPTR
jgi:hypothetical protein